jgi:hypothetical protein
VERNAGALDFVIIQSALYMRYASGEQVHNLPPIRPRAVALLRRFHMNAIVFNLNLSTRKRNDAPAAVRIFVTARDPRRVR